jgi:hypothetical protein
VCIVCIGGCPVIPGGKGETMAWQWMPGRYRAQEIEEYATRGRRWNRAPDDPNDNGPSPRTRLILAIVVFLLISACVIAWSVAYYALSR